MYIGINTSWMLTDEEDMLILMDLEWLECLGSWVVDMSEVLEGARETEAGKRDESWW